MRSAQVRVTFSKSKLILLLLFGLCSFFLYVVSMHLPLKVRRSKSSGVSSISSSGQVSLDEGEELIYNSKEESTISEQVSPISNDNDGDIIGTTSALPTPPPSEVQADAPVGSLKVDFDPHGGDVLVVLHTQKTGGSEFLRHLVTVRRDGQLLCVLPRDMMDAIERSSRVPRHKKRGKRTVSKSHTSCPRDPSNPDGRQWLVAERTMGWVCGLHASYTEYRSCLPKLKNPKFSLEGSRSLHFAVLLRHPVLRYLSEYLHVQRNATWTSPHLCGGKPVSTSDMPPCYRGYYQRKPWPNLTLSAFVSCESNWGNNRQTMMLADLEAVHCYDRSAMSEGERERRLLESAKSNLRSFSFFGLTEYMPESCRLFEETFGVSFAVSPQQRNVSELHSAPMLSDLWTHGDLYEAILRANHLDVQLYDFALELFSQRARSVGVAVNKELVEQAVESIRTDPQQISKALGKYKKINYKIS